MPADSLPGPTPRRLYDAQGRLISSTDAWGTITYTHYDADGRRIDPDDPPPSGGVLPGPDTFPDNRIRPVVWFLAC